MLSEIHELDANRQRNQLWLLVGFQSLVDGEQGQLQDLAAGEVNVIGNADLADVDADNELVAFLERGFDADIAEHQKVGFLDFVVGVVARDFVWRPDGRHQGFRKCSRQGHGTGKDCGLKGFSCDIRHVVTIGAVKADWLVNLHDRDRRGGSGPNAAQPSQQQKPLHAPIMEQVRVFREKDLVHFLEMDEPGFRSAREAHRSASLKTRCQLGDSLL